MCRRLKFKDGWEVVDPIGRKGVLLILWGDNVHVYRMFKSNFCIEMEIECDSFAGEC